MLEGKLTTLRPLASDDVERFYTWINDREVIRFLGARYPMSRADEERWLTDTSSSDFQKGVTLAIDTREGRHIGNISLRAAEPEARHAVLGIMIGEKDCWSNGYGRDAIAALLRFAFGEMNLHRVSLHAFAFNERAIACYTRCGFQIEGRLRDHRYSDGRYWDVVAMAVLRDEFEALEQAWRAAGAVETGAP